MTTELFKLLTSYLTAVENMLSSTVNPLYNVNVCSKLSLTLK